MCVDGACMSGTQGKGKTKGEGKSDEPKGKGEGKGKGKKGKETRICHECNKLGHLREDSFVCGTENWAPLPRVFHNTNESGSVRHECELKSVMTS